jgi:cell division septum initiation protein DivIVA
MKTKQQEIEILDGAIKSLGADSYLGPWLKQIRDGVADLVKCDIFPDITLNQAILSSDNIKRHAQTEAEKIVAAAKSKADSIEKSADKHQDHIAGNIREALRALEKW